MIELIIKDNIIKLHINGFWIYLLCFWLGLSIVGTGLKIYAHILKIRLNKGE